MSDRRMMSLKDAADTYFDAGVTSNTLLRLYHAGRLRCRKVGRRYMVSIAELEKFVEGEACPDAENQPASGSTRGTKSGSSKTDQRNDQRDAVKRNAKRLMKRSKTTSQPSGQPGRASGALTTSSSGRS